MGFIQRFIRAEIVHRRLSPDETTIHVQAARIAQLVEQVRLWQLEYHKAARNVSHLNRRLASTRRVSKRRYHLIRSLKEAARKRDAA